MLVEYKVNRRKVRWQWHWWHFAFGIVKPTPVQWSILLGFVEVSILSYTECKFGYEWKAKEEGKNNV